MMLLATFEAAALCVVLWHALCALNDISRGTRLSIAAAVVLIFAGAFARLVLLLDGLADPNPVIAAFVAGVALGMLADRRRAEKSPRVLAFKRGHHNDTESPA